MAEFPDRIYVDKDDKELYEKIKEEEIFQDRENKDLFIIAMAYGFKHQVKRKLDKKEGYLRTEYLKREDWGLINSVAVNDGLIDNLNDREAVLKLAEEYAHGGIKLLCDYIDSIQHGSFDRQFEKELLDLFDELQYHKETPEI